MARTLDDEVARVLEAGSCSGCGACAQLDAGLEMHLDAAGFNRPRRVGAPTADDTAVRRFRASCPGVLVTAPVETGSRRHPTMGSYLEAWEAWAADPEVRHQGSSGGTITALTSWMTSTGEAAAVVGAAASPASPERTVTVQITSREEALAAAGSRYGPVSNAAAPGALDAPAFVGKPCEVSALRQLAAAGGTEPPVLLSFFCAGTPSQHATTAVLAGMGVEDGEPLEAMWYRGRGWPGFFTAVTRAGRRLETSYDDSWGSTLGPAVQWRCKICPDGVGESSDVTAADFWVADDDGYPVFAEGAGSSALVVRTRRGADLVRRAVEAGVLEVRPIDVDDLARVQPLQRRRRETLLGRLVGARLAGRRAPRFRGFGLVRLARRSPREALRTARGSRSRVLRDRARR